MKIIFHFLQIACLASAFFPACSKPAEPARKAKFYQSPMHPWITSDKPGNCTICGMDLVPVYEGEAGLASKSGVVSLTPDSVSVLGVTTVPVRRMELTKSLRFSGILEDDENLHRVIAAFYDGRIEQVYVGHVGQYVQQGQPLAAIYSPDLLYVVREYQHAIGGGNTAVARNSAQRLVQYGLTPEQLARLAKLPQNVYTIDLEAPVSGTVLTKKAFKGQYIKTGEPLFEMGDLARLWFHAEVYERDLADVRTGQTAVIRTPTVPGRNFEGVVTFIDPNFDEKTRSTKVRIEVDNPPAEGDQRGLRRVLPHRAYAESVIRADLGNMLVVPRSAILRDGRRSVVYVETADGNYAQRDVRVGAVGDEGAQILEGLGEGEKVVVEGNLMIDAEAQLRQGAVMPTAPPQPAPGPALAPQKEAATFLEELARVSNALAMDDAVAAIQAGQNLHNLATAIPETRNGAVDDAVMKLKALSETPGGGDLKSVRRTFLPWSLDGAALAQALARAGQLPGVHVYECPMTGDSFPGAPSKAQWVQSGTETLNPYLGAAMLNCGTEVKP